MLSVTYIELFRHHSGKWSRKILAGFYALSDFVLLTILSWLEYHLQYLLSPLQLFCATNLQPIVYYYFCTYGTWIGRKISKLLSYQCWIRTNWNIAFQMFVVSLLQSVSHLMTLHIVVRTILLGQRQWNKIYSYSTARGTNFDSPYWI